MRNIERGAMPRHEGKGMRGFYVPRTQSKQKSSIGTHDLCGCNSHGHPDSQHRNDLRKKYGAKIIETKYHNRIIINVTEYSTCVIKE